MASARKKQDEKNLKTLRELVSLPYNKYCFDCNQRGPTYVNVTIGSFVCTKCSGMLRGLTPPHRVKSISMATFTPEEIDLVQSRGNEYCRRTWLGLYEGAPLTEARDEQQIHDLMMDKYERRRYYIDQPVSGNALSHGPSSNTNSSNNNNNSNGGNSIAIPRANGFKQQLGLNGDVSAPNTKHSPLRRLNNGMVANGAIVDNSRMKTNGITISRPVVPASMSTHSKGIDFVANFDSADIFNGANINNNNNNNTTNTSHRVNSNGVITNGVQSNHSVVQQQQVSFANFDNNPVFTNTNPFIQPNLQDNGPCCQSEWISFFDSDVNIDYSNDYVCVPNTNNLSQKNTANVPPAPPEDRYAALKDLDNALKNHQSTVDWTNSNSSSVYSSPTPTSSMYNSSSPQSLYGSPSQGQFISIFSQQETGSNSSTSNPFNSGQVWGNSSTIGTTASPLTNGMTNGSNPNPFRVAAPPSDPFKMNGFAQNFQQTTTFAPINGSMWAPNPFKVTTNGHSNNPFL